MYFCPCYKCQTLSLLPLENGTCEQDEDEVNAVFTILLSEKRLNLSALLAQKKYGKQGNKDGVGCFFMLEEDGLGKVLQLTGTKGTGVVGDVPNIYYAYCFETGKQSHCNQTLSLDFK